MVGFLPLRVTARPPSIWAWGSKRETTNPMSLKVARPSLRLLSSFNFSSSLQSTPDRPRARVRLVTVLELILGLHTPAHTERHESRAGRGSSSEPLQ